LNTQTPDTAAETSRQSEWRRRRVAILLFDDVEVLDFAGPFEVFSITRSHAGEAAFDVITVALEPGEVAARGNLRVVPTMRATELGNADILVVPGGFGARREMAKSETVAFVRRVSGSAEIVLSVCTGALLMGAAGLLHGQGATTHWAAMDELTALDTGAEIYPDARIVDNGRIIVSAGVSAGIDAALHVVARLLGPEEAKATAAMMQYEASCTPEQVVSC
jgi:transcriptional regulator GlxA family with amidase domain